MDIKTNQKVVFADRELNLSEISRNINVSVSYLSRIFAGKRSPSVKTAKKIADSLNMKLEHFLDTLEMNTC